MRRWIRRLAAGTLLALLAGASAPPVRAAVPLTLVQETRVDLDVRLTLAGVPGTKRDAAEVLSTPAGRTVSVVRTFDLTGDPLRVFLALTPEPDEGREICRVRLVSETRRGARGASLKRTLELGPERATVIDLWSAPDGARLVLAVSASWIRVPKLMPVVPGSEPVEFRVQQFAREGDVQELIDERVLIGIVGSPIRTTLEHTRPRNHAAPAATGSKSEDVVPEGGTLLLELLPQRIEDGALVVSAKASLGTPGPDAAPPREGFASARSLPGDSFELRIGLGGEGRVLVFRITPYF